MLTRCPACQTVFRVSSEQLAARAGRVRCGHCLNAFNAEHNRVDDGPDTDRPPGPGAAETASTPALPETPAPAPAEPATPVPETSQPAHPWVEAGIATFTIEEVEDAPDRDAPEPASTPFAPSAPPAEALPAVLHTRFNPIPTVSPVSLRAEWEAAETLATPEEAPAAGNLMKEAPSSEMPAEALAERAAAVAAPLLAHHDSAAETPVLAEAVAAGVEIPPPLEMAEARRHRLGMAVGCLVALLAAQSLFLFRQPLTQAIPALRPALAGLCDRLGCALPLPREAAQISIETSDLHPEPGGQGEFVLHATLRNRAGYPQAYPHVELSLTDAADKALVRRVFSPEEWAPEPARSAGGFAPGSTAEVTLPFSAAGVAALGYRVYAFYP